MQKYFLSSLILFGIILSGCGIDRAENRESTQLEKLDKIPWDSGPDIVTIVEFFDLNNEESRDTFSILEDLKAEYGEKLIVERKHFPLTSDGELLAEAMECSGSPEEFMEEYFQNSFGESDDLSLLDIALGLGVDEVEFSTCRSSGAKKDIVKRDITLGRRHNVHSVPYFIIQEKVEFDSFLDAETFAKVLDHIFNPPRY